MTWTTVAPIMEGWYWFSEPDGRRRIVSVYRQGSWHGPLAARGENFNLVDLTGHRWPDR